MGFSTRLKDLRVQRGMSQKQVADATGISESGCQYYEYGQRSPRLEQLVALADFFDVSLDYLVGRSDDPARH